MGGPFARGPRRRTGIIRQTARQDPGPYHEKHRGQTRRVHQPVSRHQGRTVTDRLRLLRIGLRTFRHGRAGRLHCRRRRAFRTLPHDPDEHARRPEDPVRDDGMVGMGAGRHGRPSAGDRRAGAGPRNGIHSRQDRHGILPRRARARHGGPRGADHGLIGFQQAAGTIGFPGRRAGTDLTHRGNHGHRRGQAPLSDARQRRQAGCGHHPRPSDAPIRP